MTADGRAFVWGNNQYYQVLNDAAGEKVSLVSQINIPNETSGIVDLQFGGSRSAPNACSCTYR